MQIKAKNSLYDFLEEIYSKYNKKKFIHPDPLEFLYRYKEKEDIELVGLISSSLSLGRVEKILEAIERILKPLGKSPSEKLKLVNGKDLKEMFKGFVYRFFKEEDIVRLLYTLKIIKEQHHTLENLLYSIYHKNQNFILSIDELIKHMEKINGREFGMLLPKPSKGSSCKRLFLFLRWMIRKDDIDLGIWEKFNPNKLVVPMDTHMTNIASKLFKIKEIKSVNLKKAIKITRYFAKENREDPVKYDFSLTRFGINRDFNKEKLLKNIDKL